MKNKIHFFGDSIVYGWGCYSDQEYYQKSKHPRKKIFSQIVGEELGYDSNNHAHYGAHNELILKTLYTTISDISKDDIICIFDTQAGRSIFQSEESLVHGWPENSYIQISSEKKLLNHYDLRVEYRNKLYNWYYDWFSSTTISLQKMGYNIFYFPLFGFHFLKKIKCELISTEIPSIDDGHLSFSGHETMAEYVIDTIKNNARRRWVL